MARTEAARHRNDAPFDGTAGASEIVGTVILLAITVVVAAGFLGLLLSLPPPQDQGTMSLQAFILPTATTRLVVEHQGGRAIPLNDLTIAIDLAGTVTTYDVGQRLSAGDAAWAVVSAGGTSKSASSSLVPGDQVRYTDATIPTRTLKVTVVDDEKQRVVFGPATVQTADATRPSLSSARTLTATVVEVTFDETMNAIAASDFTVAAVAPASARLIGDGRRGELTMGSALSSATPSVATVASPGGTSDLQGNLLTGSASVTSSDALGTSDLRVNVIYPGDQDRADAVLLGLNVINPTNVARSVSSIQLSVSPSLGSGSSAFFRTSLSNLAGSDVSCTWSGVDSDTVTCTPGSAVTLPALGVVQAGLGFTSSDRSSDSHTVLTATVTLTGPSATLTQSVNVRHEGTNTDALFTRLLGESASAGNERAGFSFVGGAARDFYFEWSHAGDDGSARTRFTIPAGWSGLSVPTGAGQGAIESMTITIQQPTATAPGYLEVGQGFASAATREFFFRVTPPSGAAVYDLLVEQHQTKGASDFHAASDLWNFGVQIT